MKKERILILINFFVANVLTAVFMSLFSVYFLHRDLGQFFDNAKIKVIMAMAASLLTCVFLNWRLNGLSEVLRKLKEGTEVSLQDRMKARVIYKTLITTTIIIIFSGFAVAPLIVYIIKIIKGTNDPYVKMAVGLLMSIGFSCVTVMYLISRFGHILMEPFSRLKIHNILKKDQDQSFTRRRLLSFIALTFFIFSTLLTAFFGLLYTGLENLDPVKTFIEIALAGMAAVAITVIINYSLNAEDRDRINMMEQSLEQSIKNAGESSRLLDIIQCDELGRLSSSMNTYMKRTDTLLEQIGTAGAQINSQAAIMEDSINNAENSVGEMSRSNNQVKETLDQEMKAVSEADEAVSQIAMSVDQISNAVESQASFVEQSSASIEEMTANITSVHNTTLQAKELTDQLNRVISSGSEKVSRTLSYISEIRNVSDEMQNIVTVISKISAQTNLLAMNAAIEAAHAGSAGTGFSVVANEVRTLAEGSAKSAKSIGELIKQMIETIDDGVEQSSQTEEAFNNIAETVTETSRMIYTITQAMEEQKTGALQIREAVTALVQATENIKKESHDQKDKSGRMMNVFADLLNLFNEVEKASKNQDAHGKTISEVIDRLKDISDKNMALVGNLNEVMRKK